MFDHESNFTSDERVTQKGLVKLFHGAGIPISGNAGYVWTLHVPMVSVYSLFLGMQRRIFPFSPQDEPQDDLKSQ